MTQLAWFGGVALFFITLIFPIQFERQWITIGWALEGAALLWLFHRVPHPGLRLAGVGLLVAAFVRLALNPAVLRISSAQRHRHFQLVSVRLRHRDRLPVRRRPAAGPAAQPGSERERAAHPGRPGHGAGVPAAEHRDRRLLQRAGQHAHFQFSGNFARDMTYSIAWALFALVLLVIGIAKRVRAPRYAGPRAAGRDHPQAVLPRPRAAGPALPHRRVRRPWRPSPCWLRSPTSASTPRAERGESREEPAHSNPTCSRAESLTYAIPCGYKGPGRWCTRLCGVRALCALLMAAMR